MVAMESVVTGHKFNLIRERLGDKLEVIRFDPMSEYRLFLLIFYSTSLVCFEWNFAMHFPRFCLSNWS